MTEYEKISQFNMKNKSSNKVTLKMIAEKAGVSVSCVTRCINDSGYVAEKKKKAVQAVMEELKYVPNRHARMLRGERSKLLAYIYLAVDENIFFTKIATRIESISFRKGYTILSFALTNTNSVAFKEVMESLMSYGVDGLIFNTGSNQSIIEKVREVVRTISVPTVMIERCGDIYNVEKVLIDNTEGSYIAVSKLAAMGHRRIGFFGVNPESKVEQERYDGYLQAMEEVDPEYAKGHSFFTTAYTVENGCYRFREILDILKKEEKSVKPTAFLIASDILAAGAYRAISERGLKIPDDISLVGYDDTIAEFLSPPLATMQLPAEEIAEAATDILIYRIESSTEHDAHRTVKIGPVFIPRRSVKDLRGQ